MKRFALIALVAGSVLGGLLLTYSLWSAPATPLSQISTVSASEAGAVLDGPAGWHYRHSQPTHWRSSMLQH